MLIGASPRASLALYRAAQARAAILGRAFVMPDDVKSMAPHVLAHRLVADGQSRLRGRRPEDMLAEVIERTPAPVDAI